MRWHSPPESVLERLAERQVVQADVAQGLQLAQRAISLARPWRKEVQRLPDGHVEHVGDRFAVELVGQHFVLEALAAADLAGHLDFVHERQVDVDDAQALAGFAGALGVEAEQRRADLVGRGKGLAHVVHDAGVGGGVRAAGDAHRRLVDHDRVGVLAQKALVDQRALARAGHARDHGQDAGRNVDADVLQVVGAGVGDRQLALGRAKARLDRHAPASGAARQGVGVEQVGEAAFVDDRAAATCRRCGPTSTT